MRLAVHRLESFVTEVLVSLDVLPDHAATTARRLVEADLRGRSGHGVIRLPPYVTRIEAGGINLRPSITRLRETPVSVLIDGDNALGQVVMTLAVEAAVEKAAAAGMAWVGTVRSNHAGAGGVYAALAGRHDLIAIYLAVASANVMPPWGGRERLLGTNPIAIVIPAGDESAFELDIATTVASHGTIKVKADAGESIPVGWVMDFDGSPITDPGRADDGYLVPIGGYKGSGLTIAIGLLAGVLNGAAFGSEVIDHRSIPDQPANTGQSLFVMNPELFRDFQGFREAVDHHLQVLRVSGHPGSVHIPGEGPARLRAEQLRDGVVISETLLAQLRKLADRFEIEDRLEV
jgi:LDH2 family malate/lactate/ureidoglycolate dehydrogenase